MIATGITGTTRPVLAVPRDIRWGRTYEGYGEDPSWSHRLALAACAACRATTWRPPTRCSPPPSTSWATARPPSAPRRSPTACSTAAMPSSTRRRCGACTSPRTSTRSSERRPQRHGLLLQLAGCADARPRLPHPRRAARRARLHGLRGVGLGRRRRRGRRLPGRRGREPRRRDRHEHGAVRRTERFIRTVLDAVRRGDLTVERSTRPSRRSCASSSSSACSSARSATRRCRQTWAPTRTARSRATPSPARWSC
jgi:hypothetical protein